MKIHDIVTLCKQYGENTTLKQVLITMQGDKYYMCPKCKGKGEVEHLIRGIHGYTNDKITFIKCDLCNGDGYTRKQYKPKMVQDGWE